MHYDVFWIESKSGYSDHNGLGPEDHNDVRGADRPEPMVGVRVVADRGGSLAPMFVHVEQDVDTRPKWSG